MKVVIVSVRSEMMCGRFNIELFGLGKTRSKHNVYVGRRRLRIEWGKGRTCRSPRPLTFLN